METLQLPGFDTLSTQLVQELYDPANQLISDPKLANADSRQVFAAFILDLYGMSPESLEALLPALVCDAVESGLDTEEVLIARAEKLVDVEELVVPSVQNLVERTQQQAKDTLEQIGIERIPPKKRALYASARIAQAAYDGKRRKTGEPYYEHPKRAAAMALHIFNKLKEEGYVIEPEFRDAVICTALLHDATEETIRSCKYYDPDRPKGFSPLLVREVFHQTDNPHGYIVANSLRLMTHYAKHDWAPDYETYVKLGSADFIFDLVKPLDMGDNLLHPKPITEDMDSRILEKIHDKRALYTELIGTLAINAAQHTDNADNKLWSPRYFAILRSIELDDMPDMIQDLNVHIYGSNEEPVYKTAGRLRPGSSVSELIFQEAI